jgi:hypothetical protein
MLYTLFGLIVADGLITRFLVSGGHGLEANPFLQFWAADDMFLAIKVSGAFLATLMLWLRYNAVPRLVFGIAAFFLVFYTCIVFWNLLVYLTV